MEQISGKQAPKKRSWLEPPEWWERWHPLRWVLGILLLYWFYTLVSDEDTAPAPSAPAVIQAPPAAPTTAATPEPVPPAQAPAAEAAATPPPAAATPPPAPVPAASAQPAAVPAPATVAAVTPPPATAAAPAAAPKPAAVPPPVTTPAPKPVAPAPAPMTPAKAQPAPTPAPRPATVASAPAPKPQPVPSAPASKPATQPAQAKPAVATPAEREEMHPMVAAYTAVAKNPVLLINRMRSYSRVESTSAELRKAGYEVQAENFSRPPNYRFPPYRTDTLSVTGYKHLGHEGELTLEFFNDRLYETSFLPKDPAAYLQRLRASGVPLPRERKARSDYHSGNLHIGTNIDFATSEVGRTLGTAPYLFWRDERIASQLKDWGPLP